MIHPDSFLEDWIFSFKKDKQFKNVNPSLLEKTIQAFALLEQLSKQKFDFVFKGGTSLMLLLEKPNRFSIDIDILTTIERAELEPILDKIIQISHFEKVELEAERSYQPGIPKAHYAFFYPSNLNKMSNFILLDILFAETPYPETTNLPIESFWLKTDAPAETVKVPTINAIIGDKLTAFAPNTIGVPYYRNSTLMNVEIIKQLFDLNYLIPAATNLNIAFQSFKINAEKELTYRALATTIDLHDVLEDTIQTALILAKRERNKGNDLLLFKHLKDGVQRFKSFTIDGKFHIEQAIEAAAKVAFLAACFKMEQVEKFTTTIMVEKPLIQSPDYNFLSKYRKIRNGTFSYWLGALRVLGVEE